MTSRKSSGGGGSGGKRSGGGKGGAQATSGRGERSLAVRVKSAKGRKLSSTLWLKRQLNDPYVRRAEVDGYRSRAAYKLLEIDERLKILKPGARVLDLGAAPGGWAQVAVERTNAAGEHSGRPVGAVLGVDLLPMDPIAGAALMQLDFLETDADRVVRDALGGRVDIVLSDMAANSSGHRQTDHLRIVALCEAAAQLASEILDPGGAFVAKVLQGGAEGGLLTALKRDFAKVAHIKPPASRKDSAEMYVAATGFRGGGASDVAQSGQDAKDAGEGA